MIYDIGNFILSNKTTKIKVVGTVEKKDNAIRPMFWIYFDDKKNNRSISFALKSIELRSLVYAINHSFTPQAKEYKKHTGGTTTSKYISILPADNNGIINLKAKWSEKNIDMWYKLEYFEAMSFADEVLHLCTKAVDASYVMQQLVSKAKRISEIESTTNKIKG